MDSRLPYWILNHTIYPNLWFRKYGHSNTHKSRAWEGSWLKFGKGCLTLQVNKEGKPHVGLQSSSSCKSLKAVPPNSCSIACKMSLFSKPGLQWAAVANGGQTAIKMVTQMEPTVWATVGDRPPPASHILNKHLTTAFFFEIKSWFHSHQRLPPKLA